MWGESPIVPEEIFETFASYIEGKIPTLVGASVALRLRDEARKSDINLFRGNLEHPESRVLVFVLVVVVCSFSKENVGARLPRSGDYGGLAK